MAIAERQAPPSFADAYPSYASTVLLDELRSREYPALARETYLDFTAGSLYATSQLARHMELLQNELFGNPHSTNPASSASTERVARARQAILRFFNASPEQWDVVFTSNASQALKLVGESYPFRPGDRFLLTFDNHNSVNGIREFARAHGATATYVPVVLPEMRVDDVDLARGFALAQPDGHNLFAYPAQSNFSGVQHPLEWIAEAQASGWDVLLDAAAFTATNRLDLSKWTPDFVVQSFYKLFGYPTGVGCLLARKSALAKLRRPWFSGGTITVASVQGDKYYLAEGPSAFEDGTLDYLSIPAVEIGLQHVEAIGIDVIHERVRCLTGWLLQQLLSLRQTNGKPLVRLFGPRTTDRRGGIVTFNFYGADGRAIDHRVVEHLANEAKICLRTGCFCNPGGGEIALGLTGTELSTCFRQREHDHHFTVDDFRLCIDGKSTGAVRVSLGMISSVVDVDRFIAFAKGFIGR